jgi:hypothetical protein
VCRGSHFLSAEYPIQNDLRKSPLGGNDAIPKVAAYGLSEATIRLEHRSNLIDLVMTLGTHLRLTAFVYTGCNKLLIGEQISGARTANRSCPLERWPRRSVIS